MISVNLYHKLQEQVSVNPSYLKYHNKMLDIFINADSFYWHMYKSCRQQTQNIQAIKSCSLRAGQVFGTCSQTLFNKVHLHSYFTVASERPHLLRRDYLLDCGPTHTTGNIQPLGLNMSQGISSKYTNLNHTSINCHQPRARF